MRRLTGLQLIGPSILLAAALAAEAGAYALAHAPSSEILWYINLKLFGIFQQSHYFLDSYTAVPGSDLFIITLPLFVLACLGMTMRRQLMLAISSNLSFVYAAFLLFSWTSSQKTTMQASLNWSAVPMGSDLYLVAILLGSSLFSCCISHFVYMRFTRSSN